MGECCRSMVTGETQGHWNSGAEDEMEHPAPITQQCSRHEKGVDIGSPTEHHQHRNWHLVEVCKHTVDGVCVEQWLWRKPVHSPAWCCKGVSFENVFCT